jgi:hypothetical protein
VVLRELQQVQVLQELLPHRVQVLQAVQVVQVGLREHLLLRVQAELRVHQE